MSKTRWKDTLPLPESSRLEDAAYHLAWAIGCTANQDRYVARAAAIIRAVRKSWDVTSERVDDTDTEGYGPDTLLWEALWEVGVVGYHKSTGLGAGSLAPHLRVAETCLRTYWREAQA